MWRHVLFPPAQRVFDALEAGLRRRRVGADHVEVVDDPRHDLREPAEFPEAGHREHRFGSGFGLGFAGVALRERRAVWDPWLSLVKDVHEVQRDVGVLNVDSDGSAEVEALQLVVDKCAPEHSPAYFYLFGVLQRNIAIEMESKIVDHP